MAKEEKKESKKNTVEKKGDTAKKTSQASAKKKAPQKQTTSKQTMGTSKQTKSNHKELEKKQDKQEKKVKKEKIIQEEVIVEEEPLELLTDSEDVDSDVVEEVDEREVIQKSHFKISDAILVVGLILVALLGFFVLKGERAAPSYTLPLKLSGEVGLQELTYQEYQEKIDNGEHFVIIIERATCSHCVSFMPIAEEFAKDNELPLYYIDTDTFTDEDWENLETSNTFFKKNSGNWGTPTTIVLAGKEAVDYIEGETTADKLKDLYNEYFDADK